MQYKGYEIKYSRSKKSFALKILLQSPGIIFSIWKENKWLKKIIKEYAVDAVISDNRFGMFSKKIPSVYITHQLTIKTGNRFTETIAQKIHYFFIKKYWKCWIPDHKEKGLAGVLSHPAQIPSNAVFIGPLSRLKVLPNVEKIYDLLIIISGPEPQRTIFENIILEQLNSFRGKVLFLRGLPSVKNNLSLNNDSIKIVNHLEAKELNKVMEQSRMVIARSGYTTIMDLAALGKPAILIPTPGQTEQEYLAKYLFEKKHFLTAQQKDYSLSELLEESSTFKYKPIHTLEDEYKKIISEFVLSLKTFNFASQ